MTAFDQFAVAAFEVAAVDYLMKPVDPQRLELALTRTRTHLERKQDDDAPATPRRVSGENRYLEEFWASDLTGLVRARRLSHAVTSNIRQNLLFAFGYNALGIPIAAGVLYPLFGILLSPMIAALAMSLSSVSVIGNALRLRRLPL